ncbi:MAG: DUF4143 domain-containing protein [Phascolarctobacterium sp.]|uniref:DUF4143 domain-containing protein n=1 Tax=Phascolarctobacterium sp. TaxID=2049039 RepID=UPI0026DBFC5D|nr:DUF4143 domain-containing protein [Phascolarctobacterium sp.]MDO4921934.1 DUF4143 domain-containing protein [Phascolarctobacterium sp.]
MKSLEKKIRELQQQDKLVILRHCGGSEQQAILDALTQDYTAVDLSLPNLRLQAQQNPQLFLKNLPQAAHLANLQCAPYLLPHILTGTLPLSRLIGSCTQSYYLASGGQEQVVFVELPLAVGGAEPFVPEAARLRELAVLGKKADITAAILQSRAACDAAVYVRRVLQQDIMERTTASDEVKFYRFLCAAASMAGCVVNYTILANNVGITAPTAKQWLQFLAGTGMVYLLQPLERIAGKRLVKAPKVYFRETGVAAHLLQLHDVTTLAQSVYLKNLLENYTVNAIRESFLRQGELPDLRFYRDSNNKEITLLLAWQKKLYPMYITLDKLSGRKLAKNAEFMQPYAEREGLNLQASCVFTLGGVCEQVNNELWQVGVELLV